MKKVHDYYLEENGQESIRQIPVNELFAPETIAFRHHNYVVLDGVYHTYLFIPSQKYRTRVPAGWISLLINAGEGIDVDIFFFKQDKAKSMERIGRRIRLNRSKIKDTYDSNSDFDHLSESIHAGYYLKKGLGGSEEFYYMATLITVTGYSAKEVEWRAKEMTKLLGSQDIGTTSCVFREEQAFLSALPLLNLDKKIYARAKRNVLTSGVASCYPFNQGLLIIRGQNVLRFQKMDYTEHADAKRLRMEKVEAHIPNWYVAWEQEKQQAQIMERIETELDQREELQIPAEAENEEATGGKADGASAQAPEVLVLNTELPKNDKYTGKKSGKAIRKVEDLFSKQEGG